MQANDPDLEFPSLGEVLIQVFDFVAKHTATISASSDLWDMIRSIIPPNSNMKTWSTVKSLIETHRMETMRVVPVCVNMCVAFTNAESPELQGDEFQNANATVCPVCKEPKYLADGVSARRVFYHLPFKFWLQDLYSKPDLVAMLANDIHPEHYPKGHVRRSDGYRQKVTDNTKMNRDRRNQALSLSADGMPYFKDMNAMSGWVVSLVNECLAKSNLGHNPAFMHMTALIPNEYLTQEGKKVVKHTKEPTSLRPAFVFVIDELLQAYIHGIPLVDSSLAQDVERRWFKCHVILLFVIGDYPGIGKISDFKHNGFCRCHWCEAHFRYYSPGHEVALNNKRWLPPNHYLCT